MHVVSGSVTFFLGIILFLFVGVFGLNQKYVAPIAFLSVFLMAIGLIALVGF